jgi:hypothetical protein
MKYDLSKYSEYSWSFLYYFEYENHIGFRALHKLINSPFDLSTHLELILKERLANDDFYNSLNPQEQSQYHSQFYEIEEHTIKQVEQWHKYSLCLSSFSFLEAQLRTLCKEIEKLDITKLKLNDLKNDEDLNRFNLFLSKVFEADTSTLETHFTKLKQQKIIRNSIAHHNGYIPNSKSPQLVTGLSIDQHSKIELTNEYLEFIISTADKYMEGLIPIIDNRYKEITKS